MRFFSVTGSWYDVFESQPGRYSFLRQCVSVTFIRHIYRQIHIHTNRKSADVQTDNQTDKQTNKPTALT